MATQVGTAVVKLTFDGKDINASLSNMSSNITKEGQKAGGHFGDAFAVAAGSLISKGLSKVAGAISGSMDKAIKRADILNSFPKIMANFGVSADEASASINRMKVRMEGLPTSLDQAASGVRNLFLVTKDLGQAEELFYAVNDAAMVFADGSSDAVDRFIYAYRQALSSGKVQAQDFNQMNEAIPGVMEKVAESMGITFVELKEGLSSGKISMEDFNNTLKKLDKEGVGEMKSLEQGAKESTGGVGTALENMQTRIASAIEKVISHIGVDRISNAINDISSSFSGMADMVVGALDFIHEHWDVIGPMVATLGTIAGIILGINVATKIVHGTIEKVTGVVDGFKDVFGKVKDKVSGAKGGIDSMKTSVSGLGNKMDKADVGGKAENIATGFDRMVTRIKKVVRSVSDVISELVKAISNPLKTAIRSLGEILSEVATAITEPLKILLKGVGEAIAGFFTALANPSILLGIAVFTAAAAGIALAILMIGGAIGAVSGGLSEFVHNVIIPLGEFVRDTLLAALDSLTGIIIRLTNEALIPVGSFIRDTLQSVIDHITNSIIRLTNEAFIPLGTFLRNTFISIIERVSAVIINLTNSALIPLANTIRNTVIGIINAFTDSIIRLTNQALIPLINTISGALIGILYALAAVIRDTLGGLSGVIDSIGTAFQRMGWAIQSALNGVSGVLYAFASVITAISSALVAIVALTTGHSINYGSGYAHLFAEGGRVIGPGTATSDSIPAMLSNGEYVLRASTAKRIGYDNLDNINESGMLPQSYNHNWADSIANSVGGQTSSGISGNTINVYMTNEINNDMDADDIGRKLMTSIRRAA